MQIEDFPILRFLVHSLKKNESNEKLQGKRVVRRESANTAIAQLSENLASILKFIDVPTSLTTGRIVRTRSIRPSLSLQTSRMSLMIQVPRKAEKGVSVGQLFVPCLTSRQYQVSTPQKCSEVNLDASICSTAFRRSFCMLPRLRVSRKSEST